MPVWARGDRPTLRRWGSWSASPSSRGSAGRCASARSGRVVAVTGEAGAGKTSLLRVATATPGGMRVVRGLCDPLATPRPLGPVRDVLAELGESEPTDLPASPARGDVEALVVSVVSREPTTVVVEDVQWIDEASVEALRYLVRRIEALPVLLVLTYRDAEIGTGHPLRPLLGDLARLENSEVVALAPLSVEAVDTLLRGTGPRRASVHRLTGGNPFYVSEIGRHAGGGLPASVRDAVLASTNGLTDDDLEVLQLVATAPDAVDDRLCRCSGWTCPACAGSTRPVCSSAPARGIGFRHELRAARRARRIPLGVESGLHARLLDALERGGSSDHAVLTHHADAAHDRRADEPVCRAGRRRGRTRRLAHRGRRVPHAGARPRRRRTRPTRARMLESARPGAVHGEPARPRRSARSRPRSGSWEQVGDLRGVAAAHDRRAVIEYYSARRREAEQHARLAVGARRHRGVRLGVRDAGLPRLPPTRPRRPPTRQPAGTGGRGPHAGTTPSASAATSSTTRATCCVARSAREVGCSCTRRSRSSARYDEVGTTAYSNLSAIDVEHRRFREAEGVLARSIPITVRARHPRVQPVADGRCGRACTSSGLDGRRRSRTPTPSSTVRACRWR